ncbi:unnamed protein product, partial [Prorocentrum cordatum]
ASRLRRDAPRQPSEGLPSPLPVSWRRPMAPKRGRPSTGFTANKKPAKAANKKPAKAVHVGGLCDVVAKSLDADTGLAESVVKLLRDSIPTSLALLKEERHAFQEQAVQMIGQALDAKGAALDRAREEAAAKLAEVAEAASATDAAVAEAEEEAKALADAEAAAAVKASEDAAAQKAARGAAAAATKAQADGEASLAGSEASKAALEAVQKEHFEPLVEGTAADAKASLKVFSKAAKEYLEVEEGTLDNISSTLGKAKGDRSTFDGLVVNLLAEAVAKALADLGAKIEAGSKAKEKEVKKLPEEAQLRCSGHAGDQGAHPRHHERGLRLRVPRGEVEQRAAQVRGAEFPMQRPEQQDRRRHKLSHLSLHLPKKGFAAAVAATAEASAAAASALEASERALAEAKEAAKAGVGKVKAAKA